MFPHYNHLISACARLYSKSPSKHVLFLFLPFVKGLTPFVITSSLHGVLGLCIPTYKLERNKSPLRLALRCQQQNSRAGEPRSSFQQARPNPQPFSCPRQGPASVPTSSKPSGLRGAFLSGGIPGNPFLAPPAFQQRVFMAAVLQLGTTRHE